MPEGLHRIATGLLVVGCSIGGGVAVLGQGARGPAQMAVKVLSSRPDMVTGGDALIAISPSVPATAKLTVNVNGKPVAASFKPAPDGSAVGLVTDLPSGKSSLSVTLQPASIGVIPSIELTNYPIKGTWQRYQ